MTNTHLRLIDANLNRLCEGIRVIEDIFRYLLNDKETAKRLKELRHISRIDIYDSLLDSRDIKNDVLKKSTDSEQTRVDVKSVKKRKNKNEQKKKKRQKRKESE